ncbi:hypothetical protein C8J57DRAFT_1703458 [Mycena rebaudengoi]|nr:hypothetical protein C8J57DRAFT_1703458 [Mycena rebaudengoi]
MRRAMVICVRGRCEYCDEYECGMVCVSSPSCAPLKPSVCVLPPTLFRPRSIHLSLFLPSIPVVAGPPSRSAIQSTRLPPPAVYTPPPFPRHIQVYSPTPSRPPGFPSLLEAPLTSGASSSLPRPALPFFPQAIPTRPPFPSYTYILARPFPPLLSYPPPIPRPELKLRSPPSPPQYPARPHSFPCLVFPVEAPLSVHASRPPATIPTRSLSHIYPLVPPFTALAPPSSMPCPSPPFPLAPMLPLRVEALFISASSPLSRAALVSFDPRAPGSPPPMPTAAPHSRGGAVHGRAAHTRGHISKISPGRCGHLNMLLVSFTAVPSYHTAPARETRAHT